MRIDSFRIEDFRNLRLAECAHVPDFVVVCGGNGCGKSALLEALMTAKEHAGAYGGFRFDPRAVSADATRAEVAMTLRFSDAERTFVETTWNQECPETDDIAIEVARLGSGRVLKRSSATQRLLSHYGRALGSPGFFDYITAYRHTEKSDLRAWDASFMSDDLAKQTLTREQGKFGSTKQYLAGLRMQDLQALQRCLREGRTPSPQEFDSLADIREFFDRFFAPMAFSDVLIYESPFRFVVSTPMGEIDIDDLSAGEKEILSVFVRFHQLKPHGAVILFDEADAHLHPDLERRYLQELRRLSAGNQLILTTHSPEMMIAAGTEALYTIRKEPLPERTSQLVRVTHDQELHEALAEVMGSRGLISFNQRIVFIEGEDSSSDRAIYEAAYPPARHSVSFVPVGSSAMVRRTAERVNALLTARVGFQEYYSIVDGDIERSEPDPTRGERLFRLPVYHVENVLLDAEAILEATRALLGSGCPYATAEEVEGKLKELVLDDAHIKPYARALLDARTAQAARRAYDAVYRQDPPAPADLPTFPQVQAEASDLMGRAVEEGTWRAKCKGRDLLKAYCRCHRLQYATFRNVLIDGLRKADDPPEALTEVMATILGHRS